jgi:hypothetical protein
MRKGQTKTKKYIIKEQEKANFSHLRNVTYKKWGKVKILNEIKKVKNLFQKEKHK